MSNKRSVESSAVGVGAISGVIPRAILSLAVLASFTVCIQSTEAKPKSGTYRDNGVIIKKNADGSIETYDSSEDPATPLSSGGSSGGPATHGGGRRTSKRSGTSLRNIGGVHVRKNSDGSIETSDTVDSVESTGVGSASSSSSSNKTYNKNMGGVTVRKNSDGSIETFDAPASSSSTRAHNKTTGVKSATGKSAGSKTRTKARSAVSRRSTRRSTGSSGGVHVQKNPDGSIETWDSN